MKNLFKNLMLVAVAAMAFTACTETNDEVNAVVEKTVLKFVAGFDEETRSGFDGKNDAGTGYKSAWDGDEKLKVCTSGDFASAQEVSLDDAEGHFTVVFEGSAPASIDVYSPSSAWNSEFYPTVPAVQTPRENSVDPAAHILRAQGASVESGVVTMQHMVAYGKMTVNGVDFAIDHVVVDIKGTYSGYDYDLSYTINATNVKNNEFWFAVEYAVEVSSLTVTAYGAGDEVVAKTVDMTGKEKPLAFSIGQVSTFSVSGLETPAKPDTVMDSAKYYYNYNDYGGYDGWGYVVFEDEFLGTLVINFQFKDGLYLKKGAYDANTDGQKYDTGYSYYNVVGSNPYNFAYYWDYDHVVNVDVVDGKYSIVFDVQNKNGDILKATYVGDIDGLGYPDPREILAKPSNIQTSVSGKTITMRWDAVVGAEGYRVKLFSPYDEYFEEIVTTNEYVYVAQLSNTNYSFTIMSYASDDSASYISSEDAYVYVTTEDTDPKMEISESTLSFSADGGVKTFTVTLKNTDAAIEYTKEGDWFSVELSGNTFTVTADVNESETNAPTGSITVTAGELSQTITVTQSKKAAQAGTDGTEANPHIFESPAQGYAWYQLVFGTATDGASLIMELTSNIYLANLGVEYSLSGNGPWYSGGHTYTAPNGTVYFNDDFAANSTAIVTKNADGVQYDILFKIVAGGVTTYYKTTVPSTF